MLCADKVSFPVVGKQAHSLHNWNERASVMGVEYHTLVAAAVIIGSSVVSCTLWSFFFFFFWRCSRCCRCRCLAVSINLTVLVQSITTGRCRRRALPVLFGQVLSVIGGLYRISRRGFVHAACR